VGAVVVSVARTEQLLDSVSAPFPESIDRTDDLGDEALKVFERHIEGI
jgi:hypothetical protein